MSQKFLCIILGEPWNKSVDNGNFIHKRISFDTSKWSDQKFYLAEWHVMFGAIYHKIHAPKQI